MIGSNARNIENPQSLTVKNRVEKSANRVQWTLAVAITSAIWSIMRLLSLDGAVPL